MKIALLLLLFANKLVAQDAVTDNSTLKFEGKLIGEVPQAPSCGAQLVGTALEFEILDFVEQSRFGETTVIVFRCIDEYPEGTFEVGNTFRMEVEYENANDASKFGFIIWNPEVLRKYNKKKNLWFVEETLQVKD